MNRVSIGMQLNVDIEKYEQMGRIMDQLERKLKKSLEKEGVRARFDFTSFNTNPCERNRQGRDPQGSRSVRGGRNQLLLRLLRGQSESG
jgi:hypothetical protein